MVVLKRALCLAILAAPALITQGFGDEPSRNDAGEKFLRLVRDEDRQPVALQAAIVRHVPADCGKTGPTVDLISAVHVADKDYYGKLNRQFEHYDVVLYELVAPRGTRVPKGGPSGNGSPVSMVQNAMTGVLDLEFQLRGIDYTRPNLVHADMSPEQFARSMRRRGESMLQVFMRMMGYALSQQGNDSAATSDARLLLAFFDSDRALAMKRVLAEQFSEMEGSLSAINGPDGSTLITERNKVALGVLGKQLAAGKRKIAIFYGAGHMPDLQKRLRDDLGLAPIRTEWLVAWDLKPRP